MPIKRTSITISEASSEALSRLISATDNTVSDILTTGLGFWGDVLQSIEGLGSSLKQDFPRTVTRSIAVESATLRRLDTLSKQHGLNRSVLCDLCIQIYDGAFLENVKKLQLLLPKFKNCSDALRDLQKELRELDLMDEEDVLDYIGMSEAYLDQGISAIEEAIEHKTLVKSNI